MMSDSANSNGGTSHPRTLEDRLCAAVEVLNRFRHRGSVRWFVYSNQLFVGHLDGDGREALEPFEAEAVAEKYLRDYANNPLELSCPSTQSPSSASTRANRARK
jgi:hypothetical protein